MDKLIVWELFITLVVKIQSFYEQSSDIQVQLFKFSIYSIFL